MKIYKRVVYRYELDEWIENTNKYFESKAVKND
jgi:hypothetical protein